MGFLLLESGAAALLEDGGHILTEGDTMAPALSLIPGRIPKSAITTITVLGQGTAWLTSAPSFSAIGGPAGDAAWHLGAVTVLGDSTATLAITAGTAGGDVAFVDGTSGAAGILFVGTLSPIVMLRPAPTRWYRGGR